MPPATSGDKATASREKCMQPFLKQIPPPTPPSQHRPKALLKRNPPFRQYNFPANVQQPYSTLWTPCPAHLQEDVAVPRCYSRERHRQQRQHGGISLRRARCRRHPRHLHCREHHRQQRQHGGISLRRARCRRRPRHLHCREHHCCWGPHGVINLRRAGLCRPPNRHLADQQRCPACPGGSQSKPNFSFKLKHHWTPMLGWP